MKSNLDSIFKTDKALERDGVLFMVSETVGFRVRRFNADNPNIKAARAHYLKPYARLIENETLPAEKEREIYIKVFVSACLVDWQGVEIDGKPAEYSAEAAQKLFMSLPDLFETLVAQAGDLKNYREDAGNS